MQREGSPFTGLGPVFMKEFSDHLTSARMMVLMLFVIVFVPKSGSLIGLFPIVLVLYTLISYSTDRFVYKLRQRNKAKRGGGGKAASQ